MKITDLFEAVPEKEPYTPIVLPAKTPWIGSKNDMRWYEAYSDEPISVTISGFGPNGPSGKYAVRDFEKSKGAMGNDVVDVFIMSGGSLSSTAIDLKNERAKPLKFRIGSMPVTVRQAFNLFHYKKAKAAQGKAKKVAESGRVKTPSGHWYDLHTGVLYSKETGTDGHDSYMTPEYMLNHYKKRLAAIEAGPFKRTKEVAQLKRKIAKLSEAKDPHAWLEKKVHAILNKGDKAALLKKSDKDLVWLVLQARDAGELHYAKTQVVLPFVQSWRAKHSATEGVASSLKSALGLGDQTTMFTLQVRHDNGKWEDVGDGLLRHEAQDMLDDDIDAEVGVEYRAISFDKKEVLRPKRKAQPKGKDVLARDASPEVHRRNAEFFKKHL
jgi:hypothetical protein